MKNNIFRAFTLLCMFLAGGVAYSKESESPVGIIRLGTGSRAIDYAPYYVGKSKGWFEELAKRYGATVQHTEFQSLAPINEALATNRVDIVFEAEPPAIIGKAAGIDLKIMGVGVSLIQEIVVHSDSNIRNVRDLKGKKIAVLTGSSSYYGVYKVLKHNGLASRDVEIIDMVPADAKAAFESGQVDAWAVWPPFIQQEQVSGRGRTLSDGNVFIQSIIAMHARRVKTLLEHASSSVNVLSSIRGKQKPIIGRRRKWLKPA